jgi:hypothetical protein
MKKLTMSDLEAMTTHEFSDLLASITLILRRLPNVPLGELKHVEQPIQINADEVAAHVRREQAANGTAPTLPDWVEGEA